MLIKFIRNLFSSSKDTLSVTEPFIVTGNKTDDLNLQPVKPSRLEKIKIIEKDISLHLVASKENIPIQKLQELYRLQRND